MSTTQQLDFSVDLLRAILWQDNNAANLQSILTQKQAWYDLQQSQFWADWVTNVFDIRTANEFGLSVWAIILGVPLATIIQPVVKPNFGFGTFNKNFNHATFGNTSPYVVGLTLEQKRILLRLRYFKLISRATIPETNQMLKSVLGQYGSAYVLDGNNMQFITYVFGFLPNSALSLILQQYDVLPRPAAVGLKIIVSTRPVFGFGAFNKNFNHGTFGS